MALTRPRPTSSEPLPLLGADVRQDPLWQQGHQDALQCASSALKASRAPSSEWGFLALLGGLLGVWIGASR